MNSHERIIMKTLKTFAVSLLMLTSFFVANCESKSAQEEHNTTNPICREDDNDTNRTCGVASQDEPPSLPLPAAPPPKEECIVITSPKKITYHRVLKFNNGIVYHEYATRTKVFENPGHRKYILDITYKDTSRKAYGTYKLQKIETDEFFTVTADGLYEDMKKRTTAVSLYSYHSVNKADGRWVKDVTHKSGKSVTTSSDAPTEIHYGSKMKAITTFSPSLRSFAKYCRGKTLLHKFLEIGHSSNGKNRVENKTTERIVASINEVIKTKAGTFTTVRIEGVDDKHYRQTNWIDVKTNLTVYHKGDEGVMELLSYSVDEP